MPTRVFLADDHDMFRCAIRLMLQNEADMEVVGEAATGLDVIEQMAQARPDVLLLDISMPGLNGLDAMTHLLGEQPDLKVICLTGHSDKRSVIGMLCAGVCGFVVKSSAVSELFDAVRRVAKGDYFLSVEVTKLVVQELRVLRRTKTSLAGQLGAREKEVLVHIAAGCRSADIAVKLGISVATVDTHRRNIMRKLDLHSVLALTRFAVDEGFIRQEGTI